jgi:hypothetical protein
LGDPGWDWTMKLKWTVKKEVMMEVKWSQEGLYSMGLIV